MLSKKDGVKIQVVGDTSSYHSYTDLGLIITNACSISEPEIDSEYITVKGRDGKIDITEALAGRTVYKTRHISINFAGVVTDRNWDNRISELRNKFEGKKVKIIFDNDIGYFWTGRCELINFTREGKCGRFTFDIPEADPYKYTVQSFEEEWLWDTFDLTDGYVTHSGSYTIDGTETITIPKGKRPVIPIINVSVMNTHLNVKKGTNGRVIYLNAGENEVPQITVNGDAEASLIFNGKATFTIKFRGGSL